MLITNLRLVFGHTILLPLRPAQSYQPACCECLKSSGGSGHQSQPAQRGISLAETRNFSAYDITHPLTHIHPRPFYIAQCINPAYGTSIRLYQCISYANFCKQSSEQVH